VSDERPYDRWSRLKAERARAPDRTARRAFAPVAEEQPTDLAHDDTIPVEAAQPAQPLAATPPGEETAVETPKAPETTETPETGETEEAAELPAIDSLSYESDYSGFMAEGVSEELRNLALRRLWRSNPLLANLDGMNDYDEDFTLATSALTSVTTAYRPGIGYGRKEDEVEALSETEISVETETPEETEISEETVAPDEAVTPDEMGTSDEPPTGEELAAAPDEQASPGDPVPNKTDPEDEPKGRPA
jgi:hypothetical protein